MTHTSILLADLLLVVAPVLQIALAPHHRRRSYTLFSCLLLLSCNLAAQDMQTKMSADPRASTRAKSLHSPAAMRIAVNVVLVPVLVTDSYDRPVLGLKKDAFRLYEDGIEQNISYFFHQERPTSIGILFDASSSMQNKFDESMKAVSRFLSLSLPGDEFSLFKFATRPESICAFTQNVKEIEDGLAIIKPNGWTALFDAMSLGMRYMKRAKYDRKALLIFSDGADNNSRYSEHEIKSLVQEGDVRIFAISIQSRSSVLEKLAEESGGRAFRIRKLDELEDVASKVSAELHSEYVLGYVPTAQAPANKYRKLKVQTLQDPASAPLRTFWRRGYYGPEE